MSYVCSNERHIFCYLYVTYTQLNYQIMETDEKCKVTPDGVAIYNC